MSNRYLYVFISAGLNDTLCQIKQALDYASKYNRIIVFDKFHYEITFEFWNIFEIEYPNVKIIYDDLNISNITNRQQLNYNIDYSEAVVSYYKPTGGIDSHALIQYLTLKPHIIEQFCERLNNIGGEYIGIHIRNTDIKSDIEGLLNLIRNKDLSKIFLSTDDINTLNNFKKNYGNKIYSFSSIINLDKDKSLHHSNKLEKKIKNIDAMLDLLCLGYAKEIYCAKMIFHPSLFVQKNKNTLGGYSNLALYLNKNKYLIKNMLRNYQ